MARRPERKTMGEEEENVMEFVRYAYDVLSGHCSGIPDCCIEFYCGPWQKMLSQGVTSWDWAPRRFDYIPCPKCKAEKKVIKLRECLPEDCCPVGSRKKRAKEAGLRIKHLTRQQRRAILNGPLFASEDLS